MTRGPETEPTTASTKGRVVRAAKASFEELEKIAGERDAKGCYVQRKAHAKAKRIVEFLDGIEEEDFPFGEFASARLLINEEILCEDDDCEDEDCENNNGENENDENENENDNDDDPPRETIAGPDDVRTACSQLVEELPSSFRNDVRDDALAIADMCLRLCPDVPWLTLRLEVIQHEACWRWHQDAYVSRSIVDYVGPGTDTVDDEHVMWDEFERTRFEDENVGCVPRDKRTRTGTNSVLLMKGDAWPGIVGNGLTHKSPDVPKGQPKRLLLKVDLTNTRPLLACDDDGIEYDDDDGSEGEEYEEKEEEEEEEECDEGDEEDVEEKEDRTPGPKRSATSTSAKSSKAQRR